MKTSAAIALVAGLSAHLVPFVEAQADNAIPQCLINSWWQVSENYLGAQGPADPKDVCDNGNTILDPILQQECTSAQDAQAASDFVTSLCKVVEGVISLPSNIAALGAPLCASSCLGVLNIIAGCSAGDSNCFCASNAFLAGYSDCVSDFCPTTDYNGASNAAQKLCSGSSHPAAAPKVQAPAVVTSSALTGAVATAKAQTTSSEIPTGTGVSSVSITAAPTTKVGSGGNGTVPNAASPSTTSAKAAGKASRMTAAYGAIFAAALAFAVAMM